MLECLSHSPVFCTGADFPDVLAQLSPFLASPKYKKAGKAAQDKGTLLAAGARPDSEGGLNLDRVESILRTADISLQVDKALGLK